MMPTKQCGSHIFCDILVTFQISKCKLCTSEINKNACKMFYH